MAKDNRFLAKGRTTREASDFYHGYSIDWVSNWATLAQVANNNVTVKGHEVVNWTRPAEIKLGGPTDVVVLRQCIDQSGLDVTQNHKKVKQPQYAHPHIFRFRVEKQR